MELSLHIPRLNWKICVIGDEATGKTSLIRRFVTQKFEGNYIPTLGMNISTYTTQMQMHHQIVNMKYAIWDLAGQASFRSIYRPFFLGSQGLLVLFDLTRESTFDHIPYWLSIACDHQIPLTHILLIGNKFDLSDQIKIDSPLIQALQTKLHLPRYFVTSARTGWNILEVFQALGTQLLSTQV